MFTEWWSNPSEDVLNIQGINTLKKLYERIERLRDEALLV